MTEILNRFSLDSQNFNSQVAVCMMIIWLVVAVTAISSIRAQPFTRKQRVFWTFLVLALPVLGMLVYLPFSMVEGKHSALLGYGKKK